MAEPMLSILVPTTEARRAFWPWLSWNISRQQNIDWAQTEVVVASPDGTGVELEVPCAVRRVFYRGSPPLGLIRNGLMGRARGHVLAWFDDDDWHHPDRLSYTRAVLDAPGLGLEWVALSGLHYLHLWAQQPLLSTLPTYRARGVPMTTVGRRRTLDTVGFGLRATGSDTAWFEELQETDPTGRLARPQAGGLPYFIALAHGGNMTQALARMRAEPFPATWAADPGWAGTDEQLEALRKRLRETPPVK